MNAIICNFSGHVTEVKKGKRESWENFRHRQFQAFANDPRVSVWDMTEGSLYVVIGGWDRAGLIERIPEQSRFPWIYYQLTEKGRSKLTADKATA